MTHSPSPTNTIPSPCFVLDETKFIANLNCLNDFQNSAGVQIIPALKGFAMWKAFSHYKNFKSASASSLNEARLAHEKLNCSSHIYSPAYSETEFKALQPFAHTITFNSLSQLNYFNSLSLLNPDIQYGLRINPGYSPVEQAIYNPCSKDSRLGVPLESLPSQLPSPLTGLHLHNLCESNSQDLEKTLLILEKEIPHWLHQIQWINLGGGHLITDKSYNQAHAIKLLQAFKSKYSLHIILEPGAAFAWQAGTLHCTVLDVISYDHLKTALLDISFSAHLPDCLEMPYLPEIEGATLNQDKSLKHLYQLGGNTCLAGDRIGTYHFEKELKVGDKLIFKDMLHYTMVKTNFFNGVQHPSMGQITQQGNFELWKEFSFKDYLNKLS